MEIRPQPGPQTQFLSTSADIAIFGGSAGGGKTFSLLLEPVRHYYNSEFSSVIFRRTYPEIRAPGALWETSQKIYVDLGAKPTESRLTWKFPSGAQVVFSHLEYEKDKYKWHGAQIPLIMFDELTQFSEHTFFYFLSRNRSESGVRGYIRATCNPDAESWVSQFISYWLDDKKEYSDPTKSGKLRWFIRVDNSLVWANSKQELLETHGEDCSPKSVTFIPSSIFDNKILLEKDPGYLANLKALPLLERERLLNGNWKILPQAGKFFKRHWFTIVEAVPPMKTIVRYWDLAGTQKQISKNADYTVGLKLGLGKDNAYYILDITRFQGAPRQVELAIRAVTTGDGQAVTQYIEQEPGASGKFTADYFVRSLAGFDVRINAPNRSKQIRAKPISAQVEAGNVFIRKMNAVSSFLDELENFPDAKHDDQVDALSGAFEMISSNNIYDYGDLESSIRLF